MTNPWTHWWTDSVSLIHQATFPRLLLALILGACIGAERQWRQRAAGLRTNTLVCFGAAAFVDLGSTVAPGSTQVIAYVVSGVGFLGAGAIMKDGGSVRGLNTAATLWCSAAVGACAGAGELLDREHQTEAEYQVTRAIASRSLVLREIRVDKVEETDNSVVQVILESATHDSGVLNALVEELRVFPWMQSVEWTETGAEAE